MTARLLKTLKDKLWAAATRMRSDSDLKLSEFATPVLGLIFLRFADMVEGVLGHDLPQKGYGRIAYKEVCDRVYEHIFVQASWGEGWMAA